MALSFTKNVAVSGRSVAAPAVVASPRPLPTSSRVVQAQASATAWDSWTSYMKTRGGATTASSKEKDYSKEVGKMISSSAQGFKPKFTAAHDSVSSGADFKLSHVGKIDTRALPQDLHERLEAIANLQLKQALGQEELDAASISFTTTDVDAAVCVSGITVQKGLDKTALISVVATETEREASWSRLEGLVFHWGCSDAAGGAWGLPPQGWTASPNKVVDAGGAWQCSFEKQMVGGNQGHYVLMLSLPLRGILKSGGIVFVLKATAGQNARWLKDEATQKDFFVDLSALPVTKA